jgi:hypothetical protein
MFKAIHMYENNICLLNFIIMCFVYGNTEKDIKLEAKVNKISSVALKLRNCGQQWGIHNNVVGGAPWCGWLRHRATSRKVEGSIPELLNISSHNTALGSTQLVTYISTRFISRGKGGWCAGLTTLLHSYADCLEILGASNSWNPNGLLSPVEG